MMEAVSISETWVNIYQTIWHNIPDDSPLQMTDISEVLTASTIITLMMKAESTSEMSVNFYEIT
jgi:hypothetical protein